MQTYVDHRRKFLKRERKLRLFIRKLREFIVVFLGGFIIFRIIWYPGTFPLLEFFIYLIVQFIVMTNIFWTKVGDFFSWLLYRNNKRLAKDALSCMTTDELLELENSQNYKFIWDQNFNPVLWPWSKRSFTVCYQGDSVWLNRPGSQTKAVVLDGFDNMLWVEGQRYKFDSTVDFICEDLCVTHNDDIFEIKPRRFEVEHYLTFGHKQVGLKIVNDLSDYKLIQLGDIYFKGIHVNCLFISESWYR